MILKIIFWAIPVIERFPAAEVISFLTLYPALISRCKIVFEVSTKNENVNSAMETHSTSYILTRQMRTLAVFLVVAGYILTFLTAAVCPAN